MRAQNSILQIYDFRTGHTTEIARFKKVIEAPNWSPDGKTLYYNSRGKLYRFDLETKESTHIDTGKATMVNNDHVLSTDGTKIAISSGEGLSWESKIFIKDLITGEVKKVVDVVPSYLHGWSPDGKTLAYCAARKCGAPELEWDIYITNINETNAAPAPETAGQDSGENHPGTAGQDSGGNHPGTAGKDDGTFRETRLTESYGLNDGPEYSRDGGTIWFNSVRSGRMQAWKMDADGKNQTQMTFDKTMNAWFPHISPDGTKVVYIAYHQEDLGIGEHLPDKNVEIRCMDPRCPGEETTLVRFLGGQGSMNVNSWAPDSMRFAFVSYEP